MRYLWVLLGFCLVSCQQKTIQPTYKGLDLEQIHIKYKQKVNGYEVSVLCFLSDSVYYDQNKAIFNFKIDTSNFYLYNASFHIGIFLNEGLWEGDTLLLDYIHPKITNELPDNEYPFFFMDVDFDGEDELLITNWQCGSRGSSTYDVYKLSQHDGYDIIVPKLTDEPFTLLENYKTTFDATNEKISIQYNEPHYSETFIYKRVLQENITTFGIDYNYKFEKNQVEILQEKMDYLEYKVYVKDGYKYRLLKEERRPVDE